MCLAVPGKILELYEEHGMRMCRVDFGGVTQSACLEALPEAQVGNYIIIHAGFALNILSPEEARLTLEAFAELEKIQAKMLDEEKQQKG